MYLPKNTATKLVYHFLALNGPLTAADTELYGQHYRAYREHVHHATNPHKTAATSLENALSTGDPLRIAAALCVADTPLLTPAEYQNDRPLTFNH